MSGSRSWLMPARRDKRFEIKPRRGERDPEVRLASDLRSRELSNRHETLGVHPDDSARAVVAPVVRPPKCVNGQ